jgi:hypothetical protein
MSRKLMQGVVDPRKRAVLLVQRKIDAETIRQLRELLNPIVEKVAELERRITQIEENVTFTIRA